MKLDNHCQQGEDEVQCPHVRQNGRNPYRGLKQTVVNVADVEREALERIPKHALDYYRSGAGDEITLGENCAAFNHLRIRPRFLRDMSSRDTSTTVLGIPISFPVCVAPTAMQRMATPMGEVANALGKLLWTQNL